MNSRIFGCGKFRWLAIERFDRELKPKEERFYQKHREVCFGCLRYEQQGVNAMNLVSSAALEPAISEDFDARVLEKLRQSKKRVSIAYWSPAFAGAAVAGLALMATLQLLSRSPIHLFQNSGKILPAYNTPNNHGFYNSDQATIPNLVLPPEINR